MKITYIGHSGFLVELDKTVLLFDYYQGEIPEIPGDKSWFVFASHRHQDHFQPEIFKLAEKYARVQYVLSSDIWKSRVPEKQQAQTVWLKAGEIWKNKDAEGKDGAELLQVETLKSTDEGVAFLVQAEGQVIYHAGDLNDWHWDLEPEEANQNMEKNYRKFIEPLRGRAIDAAFVVLDPRQGESYTRGIDAFLQEAKVKNLYPMHCWEDYSIIDRWLNDHPNSPYHDCMVKISGRGQRFSQ